MSVPKFKPHTIILEHCNVCNLKCEFCCRAYTPEESRFLDLQLAERIFADLGTWIDKVRVDLSPVGEPFLNPYLFDYIKLALKYIHKPYIMAFTNGIPLMRNPELVVKFFESGGHQLVIDIYKPELDEFASILVERVKKRLEALDVEIYYYRDDKGCVYDLEGRQVHKFSLYHYKSGRYLLINRVYEVEAKGRGRVRIFHNYAGKIPLGISGVDYRLKPTKYCMRPYRELVIDYNGCVRLCCLCVWNDIILGKFPEDGSLEEIWNNEIAWLYRYFLRVSKVKRVLSPCNLCSYHGGFIPVERVSKPDFINVDNLEEVVKYVQQHQKRYIKYKHPYLFNPPEWRRRVLEGYNKRLSEWMVG